MVARACAKSWPRIDLPSGGALRTAAAATEVFFVSLIPHARRHASPTEVRSRHPSQLVRCGLTSSVRVEKDGPSSLVQCIRLLGNEVVSPVADSSWIAST